MAVFSPRINFGVVLLSLSVLALGCDKAETSTDVSITAPDATTEEVITEKGGETEAIASETISSPAVREDQPRTASKKSPAVNTSAQSQSVAKKPTAQGTTTAQGGGGVEAALGTIEYNLGPARVGFGAPHTEATYGVLMNTQTAVTNYKLPVGSYKFGAVCGYDCTAISVIILNADGIFVTGTNPNMNTPANEQLLSFDVKTANTHSAIVTMDECSTDNCHYGINVYRGFDESD
ncbi:MAG: hypothetical protein WBB82_15820 [Limnothrix sp.]